MGSQQPISNFHITYSCLGTSYFKEDNHAHVSFCFFPPSNLGMECWASASSVSSTPQSFPGSFYIMKKKWSCWRKLERSLRALSSGGKRTRGSQQMRQLLCIPRDAQTTRLAQSGLHPFSLYAAFFRARLLIHSNLRIDVWPYSLLRKSSFCPYCNVWDI